uniref:Variant surface glycoprotein 617 n=1 Tax=Trypanosoma brucei TaxID=5691 RepID=M4SYI4_9TRYP|nr:variant surface glycoprotein 617 [Trypanosoma brucei]
MSKRSCTNSVPFIALTALIITGTQYASASAKPIAAEALTKICSATSSLDKAADVALDKQEKLTTGAKAAVEATTYLWLAATAAEDDNGSQVYAAAALQAEACATAAIATLQSSLRPVLLATRNGGAAAGAAGEFVDFLIGFGRGAGTGICIAESSGNAGDAPNRYGCAPAHRERINPEPHTDTIALTAKGLQGFTGATALSSHAGSASKCHLLLKSGNSASNLYQSDAAAAIPAAYGTLTLSPGTGGAAAATLLPAHKNGKDWETQAGTEPATKAFNDYAALTQIAGPPCGTTMTAVVQNSLAKATQAELLKATNKAGKFKPQGSDSSYGAKDTIKAAAENKADAAAALTEKLKKIQTSKLKTDDTEAKDLSENTNHADFRKSLLFQHIANINRIAQLRKQLSDEKQKKCNTINPKITETDETCQKKGTGEACKDGCKLTGEGTSKKCVTNPDYQPKQEEGPEKESKTGTTNTTVSNSFVINKAPIFLAVLLT